MDFTVRRNLSKPGGSKSQTQDFPRKSYGTGASPNPAPTEKIQMDRSASGISGFNRERWIYRYTRSYGGFKRVVRRLKALKPDKKKKKKRKLKPYQRADYPGQKIQIDVKYVPSYCVTDGRKYYQYTAVDECSRWTYREMYDEHSTYSSKDFLLKLIQHAPFPIREVQTDNGCEFTNRLLVIKSKHLTMFEKALEELGILYHRIQIATPRHNGKVERQHRQDEARFYKQMRMYNLEDGRKQLAVYQKKSNNYIKTCLGMRSPNTVVRMYQNVMF